MSRLYAAIAVTLLIAGGSSAAPTRAVKLVPAKGQKISFEKSYSEDHLKNHPLQLVKKTSLTLSNTNGLLTAKWNASMRDIRTDELVESEATGVCRSRGSKKVECAFDAETGTAIIRLKHDKALITIPVGQGVPFYKNTEEGVAAGEMLIGAEEENSSYELSPKSRR